MQCTVIIPAAGRGERFGGEVPKQFLSLRGRPIVAHAVDRFLQLPEVGTIILCVAEDHLQSSRTFASAQPWDRVEVVAGGTTRQESVSRGLAAALKRTPRLVAVHDAVRPFVPAALFRAVLSAAEITGAALPALPMTDTIHKVRDNFVVETPDRNEWRAAQTPQCFRIDLLVAILEDSLRQGIDATDEAGAASRLGHKVAVVPGDIRNMKITYPRDLELAEENFDRWIENL